MSPARSATWIDPLPDPRRRALPDATAPIWFALGGVSVVAATAVAIAAQALRLAGRRSQT